MCGLALKLESNVSLFFTMYQKSLPKIQKE